MKDIMGAVRPRANRTTEKLLEPLARRVEQTGSALGVFVRIAVTLVVAIIWTKAYGPEAEGVARGLFETLVVVTFVLVPPTWALHALRKRDLARARRLVCEGEAFPMVRMAIELAQNGMPVVDLAWAEAGDMRAARFEAAGYETPVRTSDEVVIMTSPRSRWVAAVLGENGLFLGRRRVTARRSA